MDLIEIYKFCTFPAGCLQFNHFTEFSRKRALLRMIDRENDREWTLDLHWVSERPNAWLCVMNDSIYVEGL